MEERKGKKDGIGVVCHRQHHESSLLTHIYNTLHSNIILHHLLGWVLLMIILIIITTQIRAADNNNSLLKYHLYACLPPYQQFILSLSLISFHHPRSIVMISLRWVINLLSFPPTLLFFSLLHLPCYAVCECLQAKDALFHTAHR